MKSATGYALIHEGAPMVQTVADHDVGAMVNAMWILYSAAVAPGSSHEDIRCIWEQEFASKHVIKPVKITVMEN